MIRVICHTLELLNSIYSVCLFGTDADNLLLSPVKIIEVSYVWWLSILYALLDVL